MVAELAFTDRLKKLSHLGFLAFRRQFNPTVFEVLHGARHLESFGDLSRCVSKSHALNSSRV